VAAGVEEEQLPPGEGAEAGGRGRRRLAAAFAVVPVAKAQD